MDFFFIKKEEWTYTVCRNMDTAGNNNIDYNKPVSERQILYVFTHLCYLVLYRCLKSSMCAYEVKVGVISSRGEQGLWGGEAKDRGRWTRKGGGAVQGRGGHKKNTPNA